MKKEIQTRLIRHLTFLEKELGDLCSLSSILFRRSSEALISDLCLLGPSSFSALGTLPHLI